MIAVFGYAVLLKYAGWLVFALVVWVVAKAVVPPLVRWNRQRRLQAEAERECLLIRANHENREWLEGNIYEGQYVTPTMPLTSPLYAEPLDWYDYPSQVPPDWSGIVRPK
jgi:hypothetical protein